MSLINQQPELSDADVVDRSPALAWPTGKRQSRISRPLNPRIIRNLLEAFGDFSLAYSTAVQPNLEYYGDERGYIAYRKYWGTAFVLGDPVCDSWRRQDLMDEFLGRFPKTCFCQISHESAEILSANGFYVNEMGIDTHLDLHTYTLGGKQKEWLRYARNWTSRRGYQVKDMGWEAIDPRQVQVISEEWRKTRTIKNREVGFINRPFVNDNEKDVRKFFLVNRKGQLEAFVFFDPLYREGEIFGYVTTFKRRHPSTTSYAEAAIMAQAIETFKSEGKRLLSLGLSPMFAIEDSHFRANRLMSIALKYYYRSWWVNRFFYRFKSHAKYKQRFRGREENVYLATNAMFNDVRLLALMRLCGLLGRPLKKTIETSVANF